MEKKYQEMNEKVNVWLCPYMDDDLQNSQLLRSWEVHGSQAVHDTKPSLAEIFLFPYPVIFVYKLSILSI